MARDDSTRLLARSAAANFGAFTLATTRAIGVPDDTVHRWARKGAVERVLPEVFAAGGSPATWERDCAAACAWGGDAAALSHVSAAAVWGLDGFARRRPIHLSLAIDKKSPATWLRAHRCDHMLISEITERGGFRVVSPRRTLLDLAATGHRRVEPALDHFLRKGEDIGPIWVMLADPLMRGRRGIGVLTRILSIRRPDDAPSDSDLEIMTLNILRRASLPRPIPQFEVRIRSGLIHIDLAYPDIKLGIECDSKKAHLNAEAIERDRERDIELGLQGWYIMRFTWARIKYEPEYVVAAVAHQIRQRSGG